MAEDKLKWQGTSRKRRNNILSIATLVKSFEKTRRYLNSDENPVKRKSMKYKNRVNF